MMLDYLNLELGGQLYGKKTLSVYFDTKTGKYNLSYSSCLYEAPGLSSSSLASEDKCLDTEYVDEWSEKLEKLGIYFWSDNYSSPDASSPQSMQWYLEYREFGKPVKYSRGENEFPERWDEFVYTVNKISPAVCFPGNISDTEISGLIGSILNEFSLRAA